MIGEELWLNLLSAIEAGIKDQWLSDTESIASIHHDSHFSITVRRNSHQHQHYQNFLKEVDHICKSQNYQKLSDYTEFTSILEKEGLDFIRYEIYLEPNELHALMMKHVKNYAGYSSDYSILRLAFPSMEAYKPGKICLFPAYPVNNNEVIIRAAGCNFAESIEAQVFNYINEFLPQLSPCDTDKYRGHHSASLMDDVFGVYESMLYAAVFELLGYDSDDIPYSQQLEGLNSFYKSNSPNIQLVELDKDASTIYQLFGNVCNDELFELQSTEIDATEFFKALNTKLEQRLCEYQNQPNLDRYQVKAVKNLIVGLNNLQAFLTNYCQDYSEAATYDIVTFIHGSQIDMHQTTGFDSMTLLHSACAYNFPELAALAIESGVDVTQPSQKSGKTPLHFAAESNSVEIIKLLSMIGLSDINPVDNSSRTPLCIAIENDNKEAIEALLLLGAEINYSDEFERSLLYMSINNPADSSNKHLLTTLGNFIKYGADVNQPTINGTTPLMLACYNIMPDVMVYLLENGADINWQNNKGQSALHFACASSKRYGFRDCFSRLLAFKPETELRTLEGLTAFDVAINCENIIAAEQIIEYQKQQRAHEKVIQELHRTFSSPSFFNSGAFRHQSNEELPHQDITPM